MGKLNEEVNVNSPIKTEGIMPNSLREIIRRNENFIRGLIAVSIAVNLPFGYIPGKYMAKGGWDRPTVEQKAQDLYGKDMGRVIGINLRIIGHCLGGKLGIICIKNRLLKILLTIFSI